MLYKAILKAAVNVEDEIDIVLSNHMLDLEKMYEPLIESGLFNHIYYYNDYLYQDYIYKEKLGEYIRFPQIIWSWPKKFIRYFKYQRKAKKEVLPSGLDLHSYDEILANDGVSTINFKLNYEKIFYNVSEHGRGNFKAKIPLHILAVYISIILDKLNIVVAYSGSSKYVKAVEVDENKNLVSYIKNRKEIHEVSISALENSVPVSEKEKIYRLYAKVYHMPLEFTEEANLVLTGTLYDDGIVPDIKDIQRCYVDAVKKYCDPNQLLIIKPHPRDSVNYKELFPNALIIDKNVSSEILGFAQSLKLNKVITLYSTSVTTFRRAKDIIILGNDFLENYNANFDISKITDILPKQ